MNSVDPRMIHRKLLFRIFLMGLVISCIVGAGVWKMEKNKIGHDILWNAKAELKLFNNQIRTLLNTPDTLNPHLIRQQLVITMSEQRQNQSGGFVSIGVYSLNKKPVTMVTDDTYEYSELVRDIAGRLSKEIRTYKTMKVNTIIIVRNC